MNIKLGSFAVDNQNAEDIRRYVKRTQYLYVYLTLYMIPLFIESCNIRCVFVQYFCIFAVYFLHVKLFYINQAYFCALLILIAHKAR